MCRWQRCPTARQGSSARKGPQISPNGIIAQTPLRIIPSPSVLLHSRLTRALCTPPFRASALHARCPCGVCGGCPCRRAGEGTAGFGPSKDHSASRDQTHGRFCCFTGGAQCRASCRPWHKNPLSIHSPAGKLIRLFFPGINLW